MPMANFLSYTEGLVISNTNFKSMASSKGNSYNEIPQHNHNQLNNSLQQFNSNQDVNNNNEMKVPYLSTTSPHKLQTSPDYLATSQWNHKVNLARNIDDRIQDLTYKNDNQRSWSLITTFRPTETKLNENPRVIERGIESRTSKTRNNILQAANELSSENMLWYLLNELGLPKNKIAIDLDESECRAFNTYLALITQMFDVYFPFPVFQVCAEAALYDTSKVLLRSVVALGMLYTNSEGAKVQKNRSNPLVPQLDSHIMLTSVINGIYGLLSGTSTVAQCSQDAVAILVKNRSSSYFKETCFWGIFVVELLNILQSPSARLVTHSIDADFLQEYRDLQFYFHQLDGNPLRWLRKAVFNFRLIYGSYLHAHSICAMELTVQELTDCLRKYEESIPLFMRPVTYSSQLHQIYFREETAALAMIFTQISWVIVELMRASEKDPLYGYSCSRAIESIMDVLTVYATNNIVSVVGIHVLEYLGQNLPCTNVELEHKIRVLQQTLKHNGINMH